MLNVREDIVQFAGRLSGIVTLREDLAVEDHSKGTHAGTRPALILVSAGLLSKAGPYRLYATLARKLAKEGFLVLRFDLGGIGDSQSAPGSAPLRVRTEEEIVSASAGSAQARKTRFFMLRTISASNVWCSSIRFRIERPDGSSITSCTAPLGRCFEP